MLLCIFYKFFFIKLFLSKISKSDLGHRNKKKNLFFKKNFRTKKLVAKRTFLVLKKIKKFKTRKKNLGNFFFKKFFFKTLLRSRKFLKKFLFQNKGIRQKKLSKKIFKDSTLISTRGSMYEYSVENVLLRSHMYFFKKDIDTLLKHSYVYINGIVCNSKATSLVFGDCIQLRISNEYFRFLKKKKKFFKKKVKIIKFNSWRFFKKKFFRKRQGLKKIKRKTPKFIFLFFIFRLNVPKFLEVDFSSLTVFVLKKQNTQHNNTYFLKKPFTFSLFSLYNFKKIN